MIPIKTAKPFQVSKTACWWVRNLKIRSFANLVARRFRFIQTIQSLNFKLRIIGKFPFIFKMKISDSLHPFNLSSSIFLLSLAFFVEFHFLLFFSWQCCGWHCPPNHGGQTSRIFWAILLRWRNGLFGIWINFGLASSECKVDQPHTG